MFEFFCYMTISILRSQYLIKTDFPDGVDAAIKPKMPDGLNKHTSCANTTVHNVFDTKRLINNC